MPLRQAMQLPDGDNFVGIMPGYLGSETHAFGLKILSLYPENGRAGYPSHMGLYALFDAEFGKPIAIMDANALTAIRTASASAAATDILAREEAAILAILGTGEQAEPHVHAISQVRTLREIKIWGRTQHRAKALADRLGTRFSCPITPQANLADAIAGSDIITTVTASIEPLFTLSDIEPGVHINAVGASHKGAMEIAPDVLKVGRFFVDYLPSAMAQAGEMLAALDAGFIESAKDIDEIGNVLLRRTNGRTERKEITVYKSLGIAAQDLIAAKFVLEEATAQGLGTSVIL